LLSWSSDRSRREADRAVARKVVDPTVAIDGAATRRLLALRSPGYRRALADAVRRNIALGYARAKAAPPAARLLAQEADRAERIASALELTDPDPRAVIETERLLEAGRPSAERLAWIDRVLAAGATC
jgi:hypothetical protein